MPILLGSESEGKEVRQVSQQVIADIINARVVELIEMIYAELKRFGCLEQMPGGIVLTGGAAQLKGIDEVMEKHLDITVRLGYRRIFVVYGQISIVLNMLLLLEA